MFDSVQPHRQQPTRLHHPWDSPGKNTGVGCHCLLQCMKVKSESEVAQSCQTLCNPMDCSLQAPPSMRFSGQEYWSGLPLPSLVIQYIQGFILLFCQILFFPRLNVILCGLFPYVSSLIYLFIFPFWLAFCLPSV